ncbi:MAG: hypothetical protein KIT69_19275 [Propionibacteriaceae bacterium]|nr:hypothetical protein [Propionibacteriaceae bacterium]
MFDSLILSRLSDHLWHGLGVEEWLSWTGFAGVLEEAQPYEPSLRVKPLELLHDHEELYSLDAIDTFAAVPFHPWVYLDAEAEAEGEKEQ